ncbi:PTS system mannose/fructose/sorbose family transporter subunit IID [Pediococcus pentosaceus]|uniref:PTS system mannose/fructose/sorbose family transporter subunit IID n=1 Tax=Pediococcus pentosaceus TaxID=1255 RepID=UPI0019659F5F|nr:PTS system mannose/fructose/sorbose family transporter subunit IID [Pediococcus pentosaceus]MBM9930451.1 PTS system mannose/fructose/sorbose family transporter subunit IID [Pediococcus pentosaceus]
MSFEGRKLNKKDLRKLFWRSLPMEFSWHYERQMHMGFEFMISPGLKKIYQNNPDGLKKAVKRNLEFFNCTSHITPFIGGVTLAMEEENSKQENFDESSISAIKVAMMGPLSGLGDSIILGTLRVLAVGIGASLAIKGSVLGAILFFGIFNIPTFILRYYTAMKGYELGANYITKIQESGAMKWFMLGAGILGVMVIGGMIDNLVVADTALKIGSGSGATNMQTVLDGILPGMLPLGITGIYYYLLNKKVNVLWLIIGTAIFGIICAQFGILKTN